MLKHLDFLLVATLSLLVANIGCPPLNPEPKAEGEAVPTDENDPLLKLEYHKYLKEVVNILETDPSFKKMLENASVDDIKTGKIASHLDMVQHNIRTQLDELKRREIDRLASLIARKVKFNQMNGKDIENILPKHVDHLNGQKFEKGDLEKLIRQATNDLEEVDKRRRGEFKDHEMDKELERQEKLEKLNDNARKAAEEEHLKEMERRKHHERVNHPGSKDQLEEVWEQQDQLDEDQFDPRTFFQLHDTDSNGFLDEFEIEGLFQIELDKIFNKTDPSFDPLEREEEMNRMREHVMNEIDRDKDRMVSLQEFLESTKQKDFDQNDEWKTIEDEQQFNQKEYEEFKKEHEANETNQHHDSTTIKPEHH